MSKKTNVQSAVQQIDQLQGTGSAPIAVDNTSSGIVIATSPSNAGQFIDSLIVANPTGGGLSAIFYMLPTPTSTPTLTDAMKVLFTGTISTVASAQQLANGKPLWLPAGYQLRAVCSGTGPVNVVWSGRADELV